MNEAFASNYWHCGEEGHQIVPFSLMVISIRPYNASNSHACMVFGETVNIISFQSRQDGARQAEPYFATFETCAFSSQLALSVHPASLLFAFPRLNSLTERDQTTEYVLTPPEAIPERHHPGFKTSPDYRNALGCHKSAHVIRSGGPCKLGEVLDKLRVQLKQCYGSECL